MQQPQAAKQSTSMPDGLEHSRGQTVREVNAEQLQSRKCMPSALAGANNTAADKGQPLYVKLTLSIPVKFVSSLIAHAVRQSTPVTCELPLAHGDGCASNAASTRRVGICSLLCSDAGLATAVRSMRWCSTGNTSY